MIIIFLFIVFVFFNLRCSYFEPKWFFLCASSAAMLSVMLSHQSNWQLAALYFYILFQALYYGLHNISRQDFISVQFYSMKSALAIIAFGISFIFFDRKMIDLVHASIPYLLIANLLFKAIPSRYRVMTAPNGKKDVCQGMGGNYSVDSTLVSVMWAISLTHSKPAWLFIIEMASVLGCLIYNRAAAGLLACVASFTVYLLSLGFYVPIAIIYAVLIIAFYVFRNTLIIKRFKSDSGRFRAWAFMWRFIERRMSLLFGIGSGVFRYEMPLQEKLNEADKKFANKNSWFIWAHNDFYQFFLESGLIGLVLLALFAFSLSQFFTWKLAIISVSVGINAAINFPFHIAPEAFLISISLKEIFLER